MSAIFYEQPDPSNPNRTHYTIVAPTQVEAARTIQKLMDTVDVAFGGVPGHAWFEFPFWTDNAWRAAGHVEIYENAHV